MSPFAQNLSTWGKIIFIELFIASGYALYSVYQQGFGSVSTEERVMIYGLLLFLFVFGRILLKKSKKIEEFVTAPRKLWNLGLFQLLGPYIALFLATGAMGYFYRGELSLKDVFITPAYMTLYYTLHLHPGLIREDFYKDFFDGTVSGPYFIFYIAVIFQLQFHFLSSMGLMGYSLFLKQKNKHLLR